MWLDLLVAVISTAAVIFLLAGCTYKGKKRTKDHTTTGTIGGKRSKRSTVGKAPRSKSAHSFMTAIDIGSGAESIKPSNRSAMSGAGTAGKSQIKSGASGAGEPESQAKKLPNGERREEPTQEDGDGPNDFELKAYSEGTILDPRLVKRFKLAPGVEKPLDIGEFKMAASPPDDARVTIDAVGYLYETEDPLVPEAYNNNNEEEQEPGDEQT